MSHPVAPVTDRQLQALVARDQVEGRLPSVAAGVVRDGRLVWTGEHGRVVDAADTAADTGAGGGGAEPQGPSPDTQYRIGSITKTMTAVLVLQLREEGRLNLSDPLGAHLPGVGYGDRTVRSLLAHSSGMQSEPAGSWWERSPGSDFEELAAGVDDGAAVFEPGRTYHYSNLAFGLLGEVVARQRGQSWWEAVRTRILEPLGMRRTSYLPVAPAATGFSVHAFAGTLTQEPAQDTGAMAPAGQVWSTVEDLATYAGFLIDGHAQVLSRSALEEMSTPQSGSLSGGASGGYGLGLRLLAGGSGVLVGHTGSMPGFLAGLFVDRARRTAAVALANGTQGLRCEGLPSDLLDTLERLEPTVPAPWEPTRQLPEGIAELLGVWHWGNTAYTFCYQHGEVQARALGSTAISHRFAPAGDGTLVGLAGYHHGERLRAVRNADGSINHLLCATFVYTRTPYDPQAPIPGGVPAERGRGLSSPG
ncbi:MAG TPA: serine hydrolase domain-containing protein [Nocardioidaceae bacterium]|nr:serine hydrolase domain-containing protein [Nocardioidaceae bacterium]